MHFCPKMGDNLLGFRTNPAPNGTSLYWLLPRCLLHTPLATRKQPQPAPAPAHHSNHPVGHGWHGDRHRRWHPGDLRPDTMCNVHVSHTVYAYMLHMRTWLYLCIWLHMCNDKYMIRVCLKLKACLDLGKCNSNFETRLKMLKDSRMHKNHLFASIFRNTNLGSWLGQSTE